MRILGPSLRARPAAAARDCPRPSAARGDHAVGGRTQRTTRQFRCDILHGNLQFRSIQLTVKDVVPRSAAKSFRIRRGVIRVALQNRSSQTSLSPCSVSSSTAVRRHGGGMPAMKLPKRSLGTIQISSHPSMALASLARNQSRLGRRPARRRADRARGSRRPRRRTDRAC